MLRIEDQIENSTAMIKTVDFMESQIRKINPDEGTADAFVAEAKAAIERLRAIMKEDPAKIWESNIFGKSLHELVNEGLHTKLGRMPQEARLKLQETISRIINEGCSGLICLIL